MKFNLTDAKRNKMTAKVKELEGFINSSRYSCVLDLEVYNKV